MNKKLRLLVTTQCHNNCPICPNKQFDLDALPIVDRWDYEEITLVGGEPLSSRRKARYLIKLIESIKEIQKIQGLPIAKFCIYSSTRYNYLLNKITPYINNITYTPHNTKELNVSINYACALYRFNMYNKPVKARLVLLPGMQEKLMSIVPRHLQNIVSKVWEIKEVECIENSIPEEVDFRKIAVIDSITSSKVRQLNSKRYKLEDIDIQTRLLETTLPSNSRLFNNIVTNSEDSNIYIELYDSSRLNLTN